jgi:hypothetical protein
MSIISSHSNGWRSIDLRKLVVQPSLERGLGYELATYSLGIRGWLTWKVMEPVKSCPHWQNVTPSIEFSMDERRQITKGSICKIEIVQLDDLKIASTTTY